MFAGCAGQFQEYKIASSHMIYPEYYEEFKVKLGQRFQISDTDYSAEVIDFIPDFTMVTATGKIYSLSDNYNNPAIKIVLYKNSEKVDELWAFQKIQAPHFSKNSMLGFKLIDFKIKGKLKYEKYIPKPENTENTENKEQKEQTPPPAGQTL
jgi:hypothetical protein